MLVDPLLPRGVPSIPADPLPLPPCWGSRWAERVGVCMAGSLLCYQATAVHAVPQGAGGSEPRGRQPLTGHHRGGVAAVSFPASPGPAAHLRPGDTSSPQGEDPASSGSGASLTTITATAITAQGWLGGKVQCGPPPLPARGLCYGEGRATGKRAGSGRGGGN